MCIRDSPGYDQGNVPSSSKTNGVYGLRCVAVVKQYRGNTSFVKCFCREIRNKQCSRRKYFLIGKLKTNNFRCNKIL